MHDAVSVVIPGATNVNEVHMNSNTFDLDDISSLMNNIKKIYDQLIKPDVHKLW